jgi:ABC-type Mn2+/Zn2+ transport system permease subunit
MANQASRWPKIKTAFACAVIAAVAGFVFALATDRPATRNAIVIAIVTFAISYIADSLAGKSNQQQKR